MAALRAIKREWVCIVTHQQLDDANRWIAPPKDKPATFTSPEWIVIADGYIIKMSKFLSHSRL
jgi:hypothetical protein